MKKRLLSLFLTIVMVVGLLPATALPAAAAEGSAGSGDKTENTNVSGAAFGIPTPGFDSAELQAAQLGAPYGPATGTDDKPVTIFQRSELFVSYGWDGTYNNNRIYDYNGDNGKNSTFDRITSFDNNSITSSLSPYDTHIVFAQSDSFSTGSDISGQRGDAFVAMVCVDSNYHEYLRTFNSKGEEIDHSTQIDLGEVAYSKMDAYKGKDYFDVACGDFDGDGMDEIAVYNGSESKVVYYKVESSGKIVQESCTIIAETNNATYGDTLNLGGIDWGDGDNRIKVQLVAADTDRDGLDELVMTSSGNDYDNKGCISSYDVATVLTIFDWQTWTETLPSGGLESKTGLKQVFQKRFDATDNLFQNNWGMIWGTSDVGFLIPEEGVDMPEIITVGYGNSETEDRRSMDLKQDTIQYAFTRYNHRSGEYEIVEAFFLQGGINDFTKGGVDGGGYVNPLLPVACVNYLGGAESEAIFISGSIYVQDNQGHLNKVWNPQYFDDDDDGHGAAIINRDVVASVAVGNFDGNDTGSEQIVFATMLKQESTNNSYCRLYTYYFEGKEPMQPDKDNTINAQGWKSDETADFVGHKGRAYVTMTAMDTGNDSVIGTFKSVEKKWSNPDVMVVLEATPYYAEQVEDVANSATQFSTTKSTEESKGHSNNFNFNIHAGFEIDEVFEMTLTTTHSFTWSTMNTTSQEFTQDWENDTGENMVAVYRAPVYIYTYHDVNSNSDIYIQKTMQPAFNLISVKDYNEQCGAYKNLTKITEGTGKMLCEPGNPFSYPSTQTTLLANNADLLKSSGSASDMNTGTNWIQYSGGGTMTQEYQYSTSTEKAFTYEFTVDVDATAKFDVSFGKATVGGGAGYGHTVDSSTVNTNGTTKSGSVTCQGNDKYDFQWQLAHWTIDLNGKAVPVVGYLVRSQLAPPTPADELNVESIGSTEAVITWGDGSRPADEYRIYRYVEGEKDELRLIGVERGNAEGQYRYELTGLQPGETYSYVVCGYSVSKGMESVPSKPVSFTTNATVEAMAAIGQLGVWSETEKLWLHTVSAGSTAELDPGVVKLGSAINLTYEWQSRAPSESVWKVVKGEEQSKLVIPNVKEEMNGTEYRLIVKAVYGSGDIAYYYSNAATLRVDKLDSKATVTLPEVPGVSGETEIGTRENPYTGQADYVTQEKKEIPDASVTETGQFTDDTGTYPVYEVSLKDGQKAYFYIQTVVSGEEHNKTTTTKYFKLNKNDNKFSVDKEVVPSPTAYKYEDDGTAPQKVTSDRGFETTAQTKVFYGKTYSVIAVMDYAVQNMGESETRTLDKVSFYYVIQVEDKNEAGQVTGSHAEYYEYEKDKLGNKADEDPTVLKKTDSDSDDNKLKVVSAVFGGSSEDLKWANPENGSVSFYYMDDNGYYGKMTTRDGNTWNPDDAFKNVRMMDVLTVTTGAEPMASEDIFTDQLSQVYTYTVTKTQIETHAYSFTGTEVTLSADFKRTENNKDESVKDGTNAEFLITNLNTGIVSTVAYGSDGNLLKTRNGKVTAKWSAPSAGLYSITANVPNDPTLKSTTCTPVYYLAGSTPATEESSTSEYQLNVTDDSVTYGKTVTATLQQRTITRDADGSKGEDGIEQKYKTTYTGWSPAALESGYYYTVMTRGKEEPVNKGKVEAGNDVSLSDLPAGSYTLSAWTAEDDYKTGAAPLASITITVTRAEASLDFEAATFNKSHNDISEFGITITLKGGKPEDFGIESDKLNNKEYISAKCDRYDDKTGAVDEEQHGIFPISIDWTNKANGLDPDGGNHRT